MTARHCPGCHGYTATSAHCAGIGVSTSPDGDEVQVIDVVPPLRFRDRLKVLIGLPVFPGVSAGPFGEPFEIVPAEEDAATRWEWDGPSWRDTG